MENHPEVLAAVPSDEENADAEIGRFISVHVSQRFCGFIGTEEENKSDWISSVVSLRWPMDAKHPEKIYNSGI